MPIKWKPAEVRMLHKYCDHPGCTLEMDRNQSGEVRDKYSFPIQYEYRCTAGHVGSEDRLYPRWVVVPVEKKKPVEE